MTPTSRPPLVYLRNSGGITVYRERGTRDYIACAPALSFVAGSYSAPSARGLLSAYALGYLRAVDRSVVEHGSFSTATRP